MSFYRSIPVRMLISSPRSHPFGHFFSATSQLKSSDSIPTSIVPFSTRASPSYKPTSSLPHLTTESTIHVIPVGDKESTPRSAFAVGHIVFSNPDPLPLVRAHALRKGDVLSVARVAAIMAVKRTSDLIPLCHNGVPVEGVSVKVEAVDGSGSQQESAAPDPENDYNPPWQEENSLDEDESFPISPHGGIRISVRVDTTAKTGVEMEALAGVVGAGLTVIDMCKSVDRQLKMEGVRIVWKRVGKSGGLNEGNHLVYGQGPGMNDPPEIRVRRDKHLKEILDAIPNTDPKPGQLNAWDDEEYYKNGSQINSGW